MMKVSTRSHSQLARQAAQTRLNGRVVWLQQQDKPNERALQLQKMLGIQGLQVERHSVSSLATALLPKADLIVVEGFEELEGVIDLVVVPIRLECYAPVIVLTDSYSTEQVVAALRAGADAVCSVDTSPAVLFARCRALLRRWAMNATDD